MNAPARKFEAKPAVRGEEPLSIGIIGPPGGGKTFSALRIARGIQQVRGGDIVLIDTEGGRARKYGDEFKFKHVDFQPPHRPDDFLAAIQQQIPSNPACIIVDSGSDEHEGQGGYLEWHDEQIPKMGGNEWAAWAKPKAARKKLIIGLLQIKVPLILTFRAREKTQSSKDGGKTKIVNIGWQPVAPLEIVHALDVTCILPPRADGKPVWHSNKIGEDFIIKLPKFLAHAFSDGALDEETGKLLAEWAKGSQAPAASGRAEASEHRVPARGVSEAEADTPWREYAERWDSMLAEANDKAAGKQLADTWNSAAHKKQRNEIDWPDDGTFDDLKNRVYEKIKALVG